MDVNVLVPAPKGKGGRPYETGDEMELPRVGRCGEMDYDGGDGPEGSSIPTGQCSEGTSTEAPLGTSLGVEGGGKELTLEETITKFSTTFSGGGRVSRPPSLTRLVCERWRDR